jgi:putative membrane protein insertion efficiency factor
VPATPTLGARIAIACFRAPIFLYRWFVSPFTGASCRHLPTCSHYALEAMQSHGAGRGLWLTVRRLARCHPWGGSGYDPVPQADDGHDAGR